MAKRFTYTDTKSGKVIFETVEPNYISQDDVDKKMVSTTGQDPRLNPFIQRTIRVVDDNCGVRTFGRYDKNKRMCYT